MNEPLIVLSEYTAKTDCQAIYLNREGARLLIAALAEFLAYNCNDVDTACLESEMADSEKVPLKIRHCEVESS